MRLSEVPELRELAPGKVNLCLFLGPPRSDGRHELVTLFQSVSLADEVLIAPRGEGDGEDEVVSPGVEGPNLVTQALRGLRARGWDAPPLRVEIAKRVPVAAGMGGGSADAAAVLRAAPAFGAIPEAEVAVLARELGADVPAALTPGVVLGTGAGDVVEPRGALAPHALVIVPLAEQLSTASVYTEADRLGLARTLEELAACRKELEQALAAGARLPDALLVNDLEPAARSLAPGIGDALEAVRGSGADHAMVCGSGPTVAGVYWGDGAGRQRAEAGAQALARDFPGAVIAEPVLSPSSGTIEPG